MIDFEKLKIIDKKLSAETRFFLLLLEEAAYNICINIPLGLIEEELQISHTTLKNYLRNFKTAGLLKYNYKKNIIVNPDYFIAPRSFDLTIERALYDNYKSD